MKVAFYRRNARQLCPRFIVLALAALFLTSLAFAQPNVLTANYDNQRTNANLQESILNTSNVNTGNFGKLGAFPVDGQIYAQPLYVAGQQITGKGAHNVVFVVTMHDSVYAIDADTPQSTSALWQVNLGPSVPSSVLNFYDAVPEVGILSTPVIDLSRQVIYVVSENLENGAPVFRLHALSLADGRELMNGPVAIAASVMGSGDVGAVPFDAMWHLQRPGLALVNGNVFLGFGSHADAGLFHGWMLGYDGANLKHQVAAFNSTPNAWGGSIWQTGRAPAIDENGNLYIVTGNGDFDAVSSFGESVIKLSSVDLSLRDFYTPGNWMQMRDDDEDFSTGVILIPDTNLALAGAKSGYLHLIHRDTMGHVGPGNSSSVKTGDFGIFDIALWNSPDGPIVYVQNPFETLQAYRIAGDQVSQTPQSQSASSYQTWYAGIAVSANGGAGGSGIVWETTGDLQVAGVPGTLHAFDATDLSTELWNSDMIPADKLGRFAKFVAPTVVGGRVYVPTFSNSFVIYGELPGGMPVDTPTAIAGIVNGASFVGDVLSPGELIAIFGSNIGPGQLSNAQVDDNGRVTTTLADTQVFFDGIAAPLLYASSNQVGVIVPFGTAGPQTEVEVRYQGQLSSPMMMPVLPATPALFALDGTGGGAGAIVNQDGSLNSADSPAARGTIVLLYATGAGQMSPALDDGKIVSAAPFPMPLLPVQVLIDNQPAEVLYAGAAPGMVQGVLQINARIPDAASSGEVHVVLRAGAYTSPNTVTLVVQ